MKSMMGIAALHPSYEAALVLLPCFLVYVDIAIASIVRNFLR
jgi:hypothetical protein